jgi:acyl-coenzyme A synthetase/AMP-(fatty) acid ligase
MSPAQITMLLDDGVLAPKRVESLRLIIHGSAKADMQLKQRLSSLFPDSVAECYGSTETGPITCRMPSGPPDKLGSVGLPLPGIQLRIIDDDGRSLPHGEIGEIIVASDSLMERYQDHGENSFIRLFDQLERFHRTGDLGRLDQDGYLWHCGRRAGRIVTAGFTVHVDDIEQVLLDHPDVREAAVISWPHATLGETPVGFVVMNEGAGTREGDICMWANSRLEKHQRLMRVCRLSELPRTLIGKISLVALQKMVSNPRESSLG